MLNDTQQQISRSSPPTEHVARALVSYSSELTVQADRVLHGEPGGNQHLVFQLRGTLYALDALAVREIHLLPELTPLSESAPFIVGMLNLRDRVLPVMDLALRLGLEPQPHSLTDCLVVLEHEETSLAMVVSAVESVETISPAQIEPVPLKDATMGIPMSFVAGVAKIREKVAMVLHLDNLFRWSLHESKHVSLEALPAQTTAQRFFVDGIREADKPIFHERALRLLPAADTHSADGLSQLALILLHGESYGIRLETVRVFCELGQISPVPCCPGHIVGQMNLRGDIVTLVDIRPLLQMPPRSAQEPGSVVVVQHAESSVGILIDGVPDVISHNEQELFSAISIHSSSEKYFCGSVLHGDKIVYILDLNKILDEGNLIVDEIV